MEMSWYMPGYDCGEKGLKDHDKRHTTCCAPMVIDFPEEIVCMDTYGDGTTLFHVESCDCLKLSKRLAQDIAVSRDLI